MPFFFFPPFSFLCFLLALLCCNLLPLTLCSAVLIAVAVAVVAFFGMQLCCRMVASNHPSSMLLLGCNFAAGCNHPSSMQHAACSMQHAASRKTASLSLLVPEQHAAFTFLILFYLACQVTCSTFLCLCICVCTLSSYR